MWNFFVLPGAASSGSVNNEHQTYRRKKDGEAALNQLKRFLIQGQLRLREKLIS
jgi:hypothetical protein